MTFSFSSENQLQSIQEQHTKSLHICACLYMENHTHTHPLPSHTISQYIHIGMYMHLSDIPQWLPCNTFSKRQHHSLVHTDMWQTNHGTFVMDIHSTNRFGRATNEGSVWVNSTNPYLTYQWRNISSMWSSPSKTHILKLHSSSALSARELSGRTALPTMFSMALMGFLTCALSPRIDVSEAVTRKQCHWKVTYALVTQTILKPKGNRAEGKNL